MAHLGEGTLRAYADGELAAGRRAAADRHLAGCGTCRERLAAVTADAGWAAAALGPVAAAPEAAGPAVAATAWRRVSALAGPAGGGAAAIPVRWGKAGAVGAAAAVILAAAAVPQVRAAAGDFLQVFRGQQVQVVTLSPSDLAQIRSALAGGRAGVDIRGIASVEVAPPAAPPAATSLAAARAAVGFPLTVPAGYSLTGATLQPGRVVRLTLHAAGINSLLAALGSAARVPASLDGKLVTLTIPPAVRLSYPGFSVLETTTPALAVPQGADAAGLRQALLGLPFLPADVRSQLAAIQNWQDTVVLPQVAGVSQAVTVDGAQGVFVRASTSGGSSALVWLSGSVVRAVTGDVTLARAQAIAAAMR